MSLLIDIFSRPRHMANRRHAMGMRILNAMSPAELFDLGIRPADFPILARDMAAKRRV